MKNNRQIVLGTSYKNTFKKIKNNWVIYLLMLPALVILIWFRYVPMYGLQIAFKDYHILKGITGSSWVGFEHFIKLFNTLKFFQVLRNTLLINLYRIVFQFPFPIIFALMINECRFVIFKRVIQTVSYLPHFLSWVITAAIFHNILALNTGIVNIIINSLGLEQIMFFSEEKYFRALLVVSDIWKSMGWGTIVLLAAISGIDQQQYEAAYIDGANKLQRIWHITLPGITSTLAVILILRSGAALRDNVQHVLMFYNPLVYGVGDVLGTYIYRTGIGQMRYSFTTAVGFFASIVGLTLMLIAQTASRKMGEKGLW